VAGSSSRLLEFFDINTREGCFRQR